MEQSVKMNDSNDEKRRITPKDITGLDDLAKRAIELAATRSDPSVPGAVFAQRIVELVESARDQAYDAGRAIGILEGRHEVIGRPKPKAEPGQRKPHVQLSLVEVQEMKRKYDIACERNGGQPPRGILTDLSREYKVSLTTVSTYCKAEETD